MEAKDMNEMEPRIIEAAKRVFVRKVRGGYHE